jgi:hypothetical protein
MKFHNTIWAPGSTRDNIQIFREQNNLKSSIHNMVECPETKL